MREKKIRKYVHVPFLLHLSRFCFLFLPKMQYLIAQND